MTIDEDPLIHSSDTFGVALVSTGGIVTERTTVRNPAFPPAAPTSVGVRAYMAPEDVKRLVEAEFGVGHVMVAIAAAESRFEPLAANPSSSARGVFQILKGTGAAYECGDRLDAKENIACARKIYNAEGTRPWNASAHAW